MGQICLLKLPSFRSLVGIPGLIKHDNIEKDGKGVIATLKSGKSGLVISSSTLCACKWGKLILISTVIVLDLSSPSSTQKSLGL